MVQTPSVNLNPITFLKQVKAELNKVVWPTRKETVNYTAVVIGVSLLVGLYIGALDILFTRLMALIIK